MLFKKGNFVKDIPLFLAFNLKNINFSKGIRHFFKNGNFVKRIRLLLAFNIENSNFSKGIRFFGVGSSKKPNALNEITVFVEKNLKVLNEIGVFTILGIQGFELFYSKTARSPEFQKTKKHRFR